MSVVFLFRLTDVGESGLHCVPNQTVSAMHCWMVALLQLVETVLGIQWHRGGKNLLINLQGEQCEPFRGQINGLKMNKILR